MALDQNTPSTTLFNADEWLRYTRHIQLPQIGAKGQIALKQSHIVIVGAGGLGSPVSLYLAAAGVGEITLIDFDHVDLSNLQRQILFSESDRGKNKAEVGAKRLRALNHHIKINPVAEQLCEENSEHLFAHADLILDCTDNFSTRYIINRACLALKKPWISAGIRQFSAQISHFTPETACFQCLHPQSPSSVDDCNSAGVLGVLPGITGTLQANEAIKTLCGLHSSLAGKALIFDTLALSFQHIQLTKNPNCPACSAQQVKASSSEDSPDCKTQEKSVETISAENFDELLNNNDFTIIDVRSDIERQSFHLGGRHLPLADINEENISSLNRQQTYLCYCQTGVRSAQAVQLLAKSGINACSLDGGIVAYLKAQAE